jgi:hypothetical protein
MNYALATATRDGRPVPVIEVAGGYYRLDKLAPELLEAHPNRNRRLAAISPSCLSASPCLR